MNDTNAKNENEVSVSVETLTSIDKSLKVITECLIKIAYHGVCTDPGLLYSLPTSEELLER